MSSLGISDGMTCYLKDLHFKEKTAYKYVGYVKQYSLALYYTVR